MIGSYLVAACDIVRACLVASLLVAGVFIWCAIWGVL